MDAVDFRGLVKQEQLPYFYSAADVCVVPSYYESFGLVPLEALACGTPVVATDVGDLKNIIKPGETGCIVADNSPEKLADGIASMLNKPSPDIESILIYQGVGKQMGLGEYRRKGCRRNADWRWKTAGAGSLTIIRY